MRCNNILEAIGRTPLVRLNRIAQGLRPQIYVKADYINPGGSVKDRIGVTMIDDAEKRGLLKPGYSGLPCEAKPGEQPKAELPSDPSAPWEPLFKYPGEPTYTSPGGAR